jgi:hypothetical protein
MFYGHPPSRIEGYPWRDVELFLIALDGLRARHSIGGMALD